MKSSSQKLAVIIAIAAVSVFAYTPEQAAAQGGAGYVTVLDVAKVFKNHPPFDQQLKQIEGLAEKLRASIQQQENQLRAEAQSIVNMYKVGTPERKQKEAELEQKRAKMMTEGRHAQADLLNREALLYYNTYVQMQRVVDAYAKEKGISLVIRFESDPIDRDNRGAVIKGVNRNVVYQDRMDITMAIIKQMHASAGIQFDAKNIK